MKRAIALAIVLGRPDRTPGPRRARQDQPRRGVAEGPARRRSWTRRRPTRARTRARCSRRSVGDPITGRVGADQRLSAQDLGERGRPLLRRPRGEGRPEGTARPDAATSCSRSAFDMDFKPGAQGRPAEHRPVDAPGIYLVRVETPQDAERPRALRGRSTWWSRGKGLRRLRTDGRRRRRLRRPCLRAYDQPLRLLVRLARVLAVDEDAVVDDEDEVGAAVAVDVADGQVAGLDRGRGRRGTTCARRS